MGTSSKSGMTVNVACRVLMGVIGSLNNRSSGMARSGEGSSSADAYHLSELAPGGPMYHEWPQFVEGGSGQGGSEPRAFIAGGLDQGGLGQGNYSAPAGSGAFSHGTGYMSCWLVF